MKRVVTVGVYGWGLSRFLDALAQADVRLLLDVRQRRGVRGPEYSTNEILDRVDLAVLAGELPDGGAAALFCVERDPEACHRSLIAARLAALGAVVTHLRPS